MIIADRKFVINSSRERIWEVLVRALMTCIKLEGMELEDEKTFRAQLKVRMGFIALPMHVKMEIIDILEPETLVTVLKGRGVGGMVWLNQKASFTLTSIDEGKTELACKWMVKEMGSLVRMLLLWKVKSFVTAALDSIKDLVEEWTSDST